MQSHTITNGTQIVVFESMFHVGTDAFFDDVRDSIRFYKQDGYAYFYERVKEGTAEDKARLAEFVGVTDMKAAFAALADLTGLSVQPQDSFLGLVNNNDTNVDMTTTEIVAELDRMGVKKASKVLDIAEKVDEMRTNLSATGMGRWLLRAISWFVRFMMRRNAKNPNRSSKLRMLVDMRDDVLVKAIVEGPQRIIVTYGAAHFKGTFEKLKAIDPAWTIVATWNRKPV